MNKTLKDLIKNIEIMKDRMEKGEVTLMDETFREFFFDLKNLITPQVLPESVAIMDDGVYLLEKKIKEFEQFISFINKKDVIINFINHCDNDDLLSQIVIQNYGVPPQLPQFSTDFLIESYIKLVKKKKKRNTESPISKPDDYSQQEMDYNDKFNQPFKQQMLSFYNKIIPRLPISLDDLLGEELDITEYYEYFTYILHLIQKDYLYFNKEDGKIYKKTRVGA